MTEAGRQARNEYMRAYYQANKEHIKQLRANAWERRAKRNEIMQITDREQRRAAIKNNPDAFLMNDADGRRLAAWLRSAEAHKILAENGEE